MKRVYSISLLISFFILSLSSNIYGQKTIDEFGKIIFKAFKNDSIDNICKLTPSTIQLQRFLDSLGIDKSSLSISNLDKMKEEQNLQLRKLCENIHKDTLRYNLSWSRATFVKVKFEERKGTLGTSNAKGKVITFTTAKLYFDSNNNHYILDLCDISKHDDSWKLGSGNLKLSIINE